MLSKREKKKSFQWVPTRPVIENSKKIAKNSKKLKNTIVASFQAKISWGRPRKWGKKKNKKKIVPMSSYPTRIRKFQKKAKKI